MNTEHKKSSLISERGATLLEVMFSVFILSVVMVGSISLFAKCNTFAAEIKDNTVVHNVLNEEMETIRGMTYANVLNVGTTFSTDGMDNLESATGAIVLEDSFSDSDIRKVTLTVNWTSLDGRAKVKSLAGYITNDGINRQ